MLVVLVDVEREGVLTVDIGLDDRVPAVVQITREFSHEETEVHGQIARHDQQRLVATLPELRDGQRHEAQHATGALKLVKRGPVNEQPIEQFGMDRI